LLVLAGVAAGGLGSVFGSHKAPAAPPNSVAVIDPGTNRVSATIAVGGAPRAIAFGAAGAWVANTGDRTVSRIDPQSLRVVRTIRLGKEPSDIAVAAASVTVVSGSPGRLVWIDPANDRTSRPLAFGRCGGGSAAAAAGAGSLWLVCDRTATALRVPLSRPAVIPLRGGGLLGASGGAVAAHFSSVAFGEGRVWIADRAQSRVIEVDPETNRAVRQVAVGNEPTGVAVGFGSVWIANQGNATVTRVELGPDAQPTKVQPIRVGDRPVAVTTGQGAVWVANADDRSVSRIDPGTNDVTKTISLGNPPAGIVAAEGRVWVTVDRP